MKKRSLLTFLVFLALSTSLWLLIKLSENYATQTTFSVVIKNAPADQWVANPEQSVKMSLYIDGFHTLKLGLIRGANRSVRIDLSEVPYHQENAGTYSFSSQYVAEKVAARLDVSSASITMNDAKVYFNMNPLKSKVVPVVLRSDLNLQRQYGIYGTPQIEPSSITIFGPQEVLDTVRSVKTQRITKTNLDNSFVEEVRLDLLDGSVRTNTQTVRVAVEVEKFTETVVKVPVTAQGGKKIRFFPEQVAVRCLVAMRDYSDLGPQAFQVGIDPAQLNALQPLLDVKMVAHPQTVQVLALNPDKVEYLIVQ